MVRSPCGGSKSAPISTTTGTVDKPCSGPCTIGSSSRRSRKRPPRPKTVAGSRWWRRGPPGRWEPPRPRAGRRNRRRRGHRWRGRWRSRQQHHWETYCVSVAIIQALKSGGSALTRRWRPSGQIGPGQRTEREPAAEQPPEVGQPPEDGRRSRQGAAAGPAAERPVVPARPSVGGRGQIHETGEPW